MTLTTDCNFKILSTSDDDTRDAVTAFLRQYNRQTNPTFFAARDLPENTVRPLNVFAYNPAGLMIGGLLAETQFKWLKINLIAIAPAHRRAGIGRRLVELTEQEAISRGCQHSFLGTMDYQSPGFYFKLGYEIAGTLPDWDSHGHTRYLCIKRLT